MGIVQKTITISSNFYYRILALTLLGLLLQLNDADIRIDKTILVNLFIMETVLTACVVS